MAFSIFEGKKKKILGVDIGTSSVKIVELAKGGDIIELTNYGEYAETDGILQSSSLRLLSTQVADIIKKIIKEANIKETKVAMAVPMFSGFSTVISMPNMPEEELAQAVIYEARRYVPLPLNEVKFEYSRIGYSKERKDTIDLMLVAVTNELINRYQDIAKLSGFDLRYIELDAFSLSRSLVGKDYGPTLIIDIGSRSTTLVVVENDWPMYTRIIEVAGLEFTKLLSRTLGTNLKRADALKYKIGINSAGGAILPMVDSVLAEARRILDDYAKSRKVAIQKVVLSGGSVLMPGFVEYVVKSLGKETIIGNPLRGIIYPDILDSVIQKIFPAFAVAVGLALREFK